MMQLKNNIASCIGDKARVAGLLLFATLLSACLPGQSVTNKAIDKDSKDEKTLKLKNTNCSILNLSDRALTEQDLKIIERALNKHDKVSKKKIVILFTDEIDSKLSGTGISNKIDQATKEDLYDRIDKNGGYLLGVTISHNKGAASELFYIVIAKNALANNILKEVLEDELRHVTEGDYHKRDR